MDEKRRIKLLADVKKLLDKENIEFFPIYGTLLGFVRGKHIMPWDVDIDLGAWYHDYEKILKLKPEFEKLGYGMGDSGLIGKYCHLSIFYQKEGAYDFHAGVSFWAKDEDNAIQLKFYDNNMFYRYFGELDKTRIYNSFAPFYRAFILYINKLEVVPYSWFEKMETIKVYGMDFKIPAKYEEYLVKMYGENWKTPQKTWNKKKHLKHNTLRKSYSVKDKNIKDLWVKRDDIDSDKKKIE